MGEVPEDILETSKELARRLLDPTMTERLGSLLSPTDRIALAILAERKRATEKEQERCARVAETFPNSMLAFWERPGGPPRNGSRPSSRDDIAAAIRNQKE